MAAVIIVNTNSWVTIAEADSYLDEKFGADAWSGLTDTQKTQLLITAYRRITSDSNYSISLVTAALKYAQIELAWYYYNYLDSQTKREALISQGVKDFSLSKWSETLSGKIEFPPIVKEFLDDFNLNGGGYFPDFSRDFENNR